MAATTNAANINSADKVKELLEKAETETDTEKAQRYLQLSQSWLELLRMETYPR